MAADLCLENVPAQGTGTVVAGVEPFVLEWEKNTVKQG